MNSKARVNSGVPEILAFPAPHLTPFLNCITDFHSDQLEKENRS